MAMSEVVAYVFRADIFCPACILSQVNGSPVVGLLEDTEEALDTFAKVRGIDRYDEHTYDSDVFPKVVFSVMVDGSDNCGACHSEF